MSSYTITIAPNDDSGNTTTLVVNASGGQVSITDIHLHAGGGLTGGSMPTVDFGLLLQAVNATATAPALEASPEPDLVAEEPSVPAPGRAPRTRRRATKPAPEPAPEPPARRGRGGRTKTSKTAAAPKKTTRKATKTAAGNGERAYRRMPDDFAAVYEQTGSAAATADYYGVPRYSVHGWIRRIRATTPPTAE